ncbi:MAG: Spy/CpxP family protein refolding chaperone [Alphaproteobacteria bacterium]|nr:Spy/CpxP family protein refolding chaperone [Alphaproteobacteria bacterium]
MKAPTLTAGILSALLIVGAATALVPATAQQQPAPQPQRERPLPGRHVEGRIAYMWAELRITPAQQAQWDRVATAMRAQAAQMDQMAQQMRARRDQPSNAMDRLERRAQMAELHANNAKTFAAAFKPLYDSLSDDQKKSADELFDRRGPGGPGRGGWRR